MTECANVSSTPSTTNSKLNVDAKPFVWKVNAPPFIPSFVQNSSTLKATAKAFNPSAKEFKPSGYVPISHAPPAVQPQPVQVKLPEETIVQKTVTPEAQTTKTESHEDINSAENVKCEEQQPENEKESEKETESIAVEPVVNHHKTLVDNCDKKVDIALGKDNNTCTIKEELVSIEEDPATIKEDSVSPTTESEVSSVNEDNVTRTSCGRIVYKISELQALRPVRIPVLTCLINTPCYIGADSAEKDDLTWEREAERPKRGGDYHGDRREHSPNRRGGRDRRRGGHEHRRAPVDTAPPLEECKPLEINEETRWKPLSLEKSAAEIEEMTLLMGKAKSVLNKLSIEKFEKLSDRFIAIAVHNDEALSGCIDIIVSKAQMEWHFAEMYANLCAKMYYMIDVTNGIKRFKPSLLSRCQEEFEEKPTQAQEDFEGLEGEELEEKKLIAKRKTLGHIKFIGELFRQRLISSSIMHRCIQSLFGDVENPDEEGLECLCKLLSTIGLHLDELKSKYMANIEYSKECMIKYFVYIEQLSCNKVLGTRVRFMLRDLLELRKNNWVARRKEVKAATLAEIHAEAKREERGRNRGNDQIRRAPQRPTSSGLSRQTSGDYRKDYQANKGSADADGWSTVGKVPKLVKSKSTTEKGTWSSSLSRDSKRNVNSSSDMSFGSNSRVPGSSFAVLGSHDDSRKRGDKKARDSKSDRSRERPVAHKRSSAENLSRKPKSLADLEKSMNASTSEVIDTPAEKCEAPTVTAEEFRESAQRLISDYISSLEIAETVSDLRALNAPDLHPMFVSKAFDIGLEKRDEERSKVATLLVALAQESILERNHFIDGMKDVLEFLDDIIIDIPLAATYFARMITPCVECSSISVDDVINNMEHLHESGIATKVVIEIFKSVGDESKIQQIVAESTSKMILSPQDEILAKLLEQSS